MFFSWRPYVSVAARREKARAMAAKLRKKGQEICPVEIEGRTIARTFWGRAWCDHMESYSDFENRLPRGRTYVRNGSVFDLQIEPGKVRGLVSGSDVYKVDIFITPAEDRHWKKLVRDCAGQIDSVIELLQGKFSKGVMEVLADRQNGLFPTPREIKFKCSCPDSAHMCKHIAAVLYGTGARLDHDPALLFRLRQVDESELVSQAAKGLGRGKLAAPAGLQTLESTDLGAVFGIDLDSRESSVPEKKTRARKQAAKKRTREPIKKSAKPVSRRIDAVETASAGPRRRGRKPKATPVASPGSKRRVVEKASSGVKRRAKRGERRACSAKGCDQPALARGLCSKHYQQKRYAEQHLQAKRKR